MKIQIKRLSLTNFKGIRSLTIKFDQVTDIFGVNGSGKTTIFDAFLWLLFGKDSTDRKDFEIKTLDENNQPFHRLDHEVEALLLVDGNEILIKRSLREKWVKKRGAINDEFSGHETTYFWNDVPMKQEDFQRRISEIVPENIFKLITNTGYFNSLKWQDRRNTLLQLAGAIDDSSIITSLEIDPVQREMLLKALSQGKAKDNFKDFRAELYSKKKKIKDELQLIPSRIDEANRSLPDEINAGQIQMRIAGYKKTIDEIETQLLDKSQAEKELQNVISKKYKQISDLKAEVYKIEQQINQKVIERRGAREGEIANEQSNLRRKQDELRRIESDIKYHESQKANIAQRQAALRQQWNDVNNKPALVFDENTCACPTCKRTFEGIDVEAKKSEFLANYNIDKAKKLAEIKDQGVALGNDISAIDNKISDLELSKSNCQNEINTLTGRITNLEQQHIRLNNDEKNQIAEETLSSVELKSRHSAIQELEADINAPAEQVDNSALIARKKELTDQMMDLQGQLGTIKQRESGLARIKELEESEQKMNQELADLEAVEFSIELFTKTKMDELVNRINGKFRMVQFKMFEKQINGGEAETCETLISGVPFSDANTASRINAGVDIINTLSQHYGVTAPIFIDNRESVTELIETEAQVVNLIVSPEHKKLTVSTAAMAMAV